MKAADKNPMEKAKIWKLRELKNSRDVNCVLLGTNIVMLLHTLTLGVMLIRNAGNQIWDLLSKDNTPFISKAIIGTTFVLAAGVTIGHAGAAGKNIADINRINKELNRSLNKDFSKQFKKPKTKWGERKKALESPAAEL